MDGAMEGFAAPADARLVVGAVVLGLALAALVVVAVLAVGLVRRRPRHGADPAAADGGAQVRDDLPAFHLRPPGSPGMPVPGDPTAAPVPLATGPGLLAHPAPTALPSRMARPTPATTPPADRRMPAGPYALGLTVLALTLVAAVALAGLLSADGHGRPRAVHRPARASTPPSLPALPAAPAPGETGAGALATTSVPLGRDGVAARLAFAPAVLVRYPVGVTVTAPTMTVTAGRRNGVAHLVLPTFHCLATTAPADPAAAGCLPSVTEYADLPQPALRVSREGRTVLVSGRFPAYTRPDGSAPVYTGHVYEVRVAITPGDRIDRRRSAADGVLTLGGETSRSTGGDQDVLRRGS